MGTLVTPLPLRQAGGAAQQRDTVPEAREPALGGYER
jgi:hypothetical protein